MTTAIRPHHGAMAAARLVANLRQRHPDVDRDWAVHVDEYDGYPATASGADRVRGTGAAVVRDEDGELDSVELTSTEAAAAAREYWTNQRQAVHHWTAVLLHTRVDVYQQTAIAARHQQIPMTTAPEPIEAVAWTLPRLTLMQVDYADIDAGIHLIAAAAHQALAACDALSVQPRRLGIECSGGVGRDGALVAYTPHSRDPDNGWADPTCRDLVDEHAPLCDACYLRESRWRRRWNLPARRGDGGS